MEDIVYFLGDLTMSIDREYLMNLISRLNGYKIMIKGNHDEKWVSFYKSLGFNEVYDSPIFIENGKILLSHVPLKEARDSPYFINVHGHLHNDEVINNKNYICVSAKTVSYRPVNLGRIKERVRNNLKEVFKNEKNAWYREELSTSEEFYKVNENIFKDRQIKSKI